MAFTDTSSDTHRVAKVIAVGAFHAVAIYGLVSGLAVEFVRNIEDRFRAENYEVEVDIPLPPEKPEVDRRDPVEQPVKPLPAPDDTFGFAEAGPIADDSSPVQSGNSFTDDGVLKEIPPATYIAPVAPRPRNDPAGWVSTRDYPPRDIREGNQGTTRFQLTIDARGRVKDCAIVRSSGHAGLDKATCDTVPGRARFDPATDRSGDKVSGTYTSSVRWVIPKD